jgi:type II secretory pathway component HofQ
MSTINNGSKGFIWQNSKFVHIKPTLKEILGVPVKVIDSDGSDVESKPVQEKPTQKPHTTRRDKKSAEKISRAQQAQMENDLADILQAEENAKAAKEENRKKQENAAQQKRLEEQKRQREADKKKKQKEVDRIEKEKAKNLAQQTPAKTMTPNLAVAEEAEDTNSISSDPSHSQPSPPLPIDVELLREATADVAVASSTSIELVGSATADVTVASSTSVNPVKIYHWNPYSNPPIKVISR